MRRKKSILKAPHKRILAAVLELADAGFAPSREGIVALVRGNQASASFSGLWSFGSFASLSSRKCGTYLKTLHLHGYLEAHHDDAIDEDYFALTPKGREEGERFLLKNQDKEKTVQTKPLFKRIYE